MADHQDHYSMYCHACHSTWERQGNNIECPQCSSASTEMITPEHDPRLFHNPSQEQPANDTMDITSTPMETTSSPTTSPQTSEDQAPQPPSQSNDATTADGDNNNNNNHRHGPQPIRFTAINFPAGFTLITTVVGDETPPQMTSGPMPIPFFGWHFVHPPRHTESEIDDGSTSTEQAGTQEQQPAEQAQSQEQETEQSRPQEQPAEQQPMLAQTLEAFLTMMFNPAAAIMGDAVYSQAAFDRVMTMLRNQAPIGGAPPASQAAIDKLVVKAVDEAMLGSDDTTKCVVCVEDMIKGEKVTVLPCNHFFHGECVTPWLKEHNTCPVCRRSVEQEEEPVKNKVVEFGPELPPDMRQHQHQDNSMDCS